MSSLSSTGTPMPSASSMSSMPGMSSTFSSGTRVTLWFTTWTTTTPLTYFLTMVFLFSLGMLNRFLGAFKSQLEKKWQDQQKFKNDASFPANVEKETTPGTRTQVRSHTRQWSRASRPQPVRLEEPDGRETEPLSPEAQPHHIEDGTGAKPALRPHKFWVANSSWSIKKDGISAGLEFVRALVGYILYVPVTHVDRVPTRLTTHRMLAVMSYNVGFLFAVTGSVLLGEMVFGRYTRGSANLAEDGCHS
jgi:hypothetical protein